METPFANFVEIVEESPTDPEHKRVVGFLNANSDLREFLGLKTCFSHKTESLILHCGQVYTFEAFVGLCYARVFSSIYHISMLGSVNKKFYASVNYLRGSWEDIQETDYGRASSTCALIALLAATQKALVRRKEREDASATKNEA